MSTSVIRFEKNNDSIRTFCIQDSDLNRLKRVNQVLKGIIYGRFEVEHVCFSCAHR